MCSGHVAGPGCDMCSGHVVHLRFYLVTGPGPDLVSDHAARPGPDLVSDHAARGAGASVGDQLFRITADLAAGRPVGRPGVEPAGKMLGDAVSSGPFERAQEFLDDERVQHRPGRGCGPSRDRLRVRERDTVLSAGEGEEPRLRLVQPDAELRLEQPLFLAEQFFAQEAQLERLPRLVVPDHRRHVAEILPVPKNRAHAGPRLLAQPDPPERRDEGRIAHVLLGRVQELVGGGESVARVPEHGPVPEEPDRRLPAGVAVVLVDQQVDGRFPERDVVGRIVVPPKRRRVQPEGVLGVLHIAFGQHEPRLDQVLLDHHAVDPAPVRRPGVVRGVDELAIDHGPAERPAQVARAAEEEDGRTGRRETAAVLDDEAPLVQELGVGRRLGPAGVAVAEHAPVPADGIGGEELPGVQSAERLVVVPIPRGVPQEPLDFLRLAALVASAAPNE